MKLLVKNTICFLFTIILLPLLLLFFMARLFCDSNSVFSAYSQFLSLFPGVLGSYLRKNFYALTMKACHRNSFIGFGCLFSQSETVIEAGVYIGPQSNIGQCIIRKDVLLGSAVHVLSGKNQHHFSDLDTPIRDQGGQLETIEIGENSWVGNASIVMANIGKGCIIGAGSIVTKDIPDYSIAAGNPAKVLKTRSAC